MGPLPPSKDLARANMSLRSCRLRPDKESKCRTHLVSRRSTDGRAPRRNTPKCRPEPDVAPLANAAGRQSELASSSRHRECVPLRIRISRRAHTSVAVVSRGRRRQLRFAVITPTMNPMTAAPAATSRTVRVGWCFTWATASPPIPATKSAACLAPAMTSSRRASIASVTAPATAPTACDAVSDA